jgi:DNA polymerase V
MKRFALADCNNFFVSCERVFNPKLLGKPVVILSSNDACVIARSNEAKKLGIKMGEPAYKCTELFKYHNVLVFSSNFSLYGDMSARIMSTLAEYATQIEAYSIDEAFLYFPQPYFPDNALEQERIFYTHYAQFVRRKIKQKIGIPISIGLGPTKTLAKVANHLSKKNAEYNGVFDLTNHPSTDELLKSIDVGDIWGIGYRYTKILHRYGIQNAYALRQCDDAWVRKNMSINGLKTVWELRGNSCLTLADVVDPKKSITVSRSFGKNVTELRELKEAISYHASTATEKLRKQQMTARVITIEARCTYQQNSDRFYVTSTIELSMPTAYTPTIIDAAHHAVEKLFKKGLIYKKIGITLSDLYNHDAVQMNSFIAMPDVTKQTKIMTVIDTLNAELGKNKIMFASSLSDQSWQAKKSKKSPAYTSNWQQLLTIKI